MAAGEQGDQREALMRAETAEQRRPRYVSHGLAVSLVAVGGLDCASTELALGLPGAVEINPLIEAARSWLGPAWVWPKMALHAALGVLALCDESRATQLGLGAVAVLTLAASLNNLIVHHDLLTVAAAQAARLMGWGALADALAG